ncbi:ABC transporter permease subunit [Pseudogemmobacter sp. W21_MBD1_M6]|uniref:ABC transporter permease subunit n=1 Tax=Pseudogemmobacter sp. W21_MBD1_M6 TaxID=3240271 RepID=UPI003F9B4B62
MLIIGCVGMGVYKLACETLLGKSPFIALIASIALFIALALAGSAGVLVALLNNLEEPSMGSVPSYKALVIIVLGGLGSVRGALLAAMAIGIIWGIFRTATSWSLCSCLSPAHLPQALLAGFAPSTFAMPPPSALAS